MLINNNKQNTNININIKNNENENKILIKSNKIFKEIQSIPSFIYYYITMKNVSNKKIQTNKISKKQMKMKKIQKIDDNLLNDSFIYYYLTLKNSINPKEINFSKEKNHKIKKKNFFQSNSFIYYYITLKNSLIFFNSK